MTATHVALIRGINVGGQRPVPMAGLRVALDAVPGVSDVRTYIQSGNVVLTAPELDEAGVVALVERVLLEEFDVDTVVVAVSAETMRAAVSDAPAAFGAAPDEYHYDVAFLRPSVDVADAAAAFALRDGVDTLWEGRGAIYFRRLSAQRTKSRMNRVMSTPFYQDMTIRNWRTTTTLAEMVGATR